MKTTIALAAVAACLSLGACAGAPGPLASARDYRHPVACQASPDSLCRRDTYYASGN